VPLPPIVGRVNRVAANRVAGLVADRVAPLAIVVHTGRTSGTTYKTPLMAFPYGDGRWVIALTYGSHTDWLENVLVAGRCDLVRRKRLLHLVQPRVTAIDEMLEAIPAPVRPILKALRVDEVLVLSEEE
jgi:deazaflavin-dependent oxidoreductase (nitroreductase family)